MKRLGMLVLVAIAAISFGPGMVRADDAAPKATLPLVVYAEADQASNPWIASGYMGSTGAIKMDFTCTTSPHAGKTCLKVDYTANDGWGGVIWQSPANDWEGQKPGGWNLTGAKQLSFWAKGAKGGEVVSFFCGGEPNDKPYHNTGGGKLEKVTLTSDWKQYTIDLSKQDLTRVKDGFGWALGSNGAPIEFFIDDVKYD